MKSKEATIVQGIDDYRLTAEKGDMEASVTTPTLITLTTKN